ncbi:hypothetical protein tb265_17680 [Gemmatimonadetes bacterium T265]|nr:hypothetical protein tb265_17680 [Gemmatimonadetes bacterium T265]
MWMVENETPFAADRNWAIDKHGAKSWIVVVRATFDVLPDGSTQPAAEQPPPLLDGAFRGDPATSSLVYEADLIYDKQRTDVLLNGHAYAPRGAAAAESLVMLRVGALSKTLRITGDRVWEDSVVGPVLTEPQPFTHMPITYERAFGGFDTLPPDPKDHRMEPRNPVGTGFVVRREHLIGRPAPNVELPDRPGAPAGFGAIASFWQPRQRYAGTYDDAWMRDRMPLLAEDFDEQYFQCAPEDQQTRGFLRGGEAVELTNLTPGGRSAFALPRVHPSFVTHFGRETVAHGGRLHTVILEPDGPRVTLVVHTRLPCHHKVDRLDVTVVRDRTWAPGRAAAAAPGARS